MDMVPIDIYTLSSFLKEANQKTYANKNAPLVASTRLASKDYHYTRDNLIYHDTYFGSRDFIGEEVVYVDNKPAWGANYFGFIVNPEVLTEEVYDFLRQALRQAGDDVIPVRGPRELTEGNWQYRVSFEGDLSSFSGQEEISSSGVVVYRGHIHGGLIS